MNEYGQTTNHSFMWKIEGKRSRVRQGKWWIDSVKKGTHRAGQ